MTNETTTEENETMKASIINVETREVVGTVPNVVGIWNNGKTVEFIEWGDTVFLHVDDNERAELVK
jgi:hypothetical protein